MINGKKFSISWHVYGCLASHDYQKVLDNLAQIMIDEFGDIDISREKYHLFLGMQNKVYNGTVKFSTKKQINW